MPDPPDRLEAGYPLKSCPGSDSSDLGVCPASQGLPFLNKISGNLEQSAAYAAPMRRRFFGRMTQHHETIGS
jgi:hypothetical protein